MPPFRAASCLHEPSACALEVSFLPLSLFGLPRSRLRSHQCARRWHPVENASRAAVAPSIPVVSISDAGSRGALRWSWIGGRSLVVGHGAPGGYWAIPQTGNDGKLRDARVAARPTSRSSGYHPEGCSTTQISPWLGRLVQCARFSRWSSHSTTRETLPVGRDPQGADGTSST